MARRIQFRRDLAAAWAIVNPILASGEPALSTDTLGLKVGDGASAYSTAPAYFPDTPQGLAANRPLVANSARGQKYYSTDTDTPSRFDGSAWQDFLTIAKGIATFLTPAQGNAAYPSLTLIDAKGDLLVGSADNTVVRKAVGSDNQVLVADSASAGGIKWAPNHTTYTQVYDLPSIAANSTSVIDVVSSTVTFAAGSRTGLLGHTISTHGIVIHASSTAPANNTVRLIVSNFSGGAIDPSSADSFTFMIGV